jgi:hypothetical protein
LREWDRYGDPEPGRKEEVFYSELHAGEDGRTRALLVAPDGIRGASVVWDARALPCFTQWKNPQMASDGYVTGLEPGTNFPNQRSFEKLRKRVVALAAGERKSFALDLELHGDRASVARAEADVGRLAGGRAPLVHGDVAPKFAPL